MKSISLVLLCVFTAGFLLAIAPVSCTEIANLQAMISGDTLMTKVQHLQNYQTRYARAANHTEVAEWIYDQFVNCGFSNTWMQSYQHTNYPQNNVIATITGSEFPETYIIVGAHYDSQSLDSDNMVFAPGADDNASGVAGLLEMARVLKTSGFQPRCSIRFIAFSEEEFWASGSETYCNYAIAENQDIKVMICFDMLGSNTPQSSEFYVVPYDGSEQYCAEAIRISNQYGDFQALSCPIDYGSDSYIFAQHGFNAILIIERYLSPYLHSAQDTIDHLDFTYATGILKAALATAVVFANQSQPVESVSVSDSGSGNSLRVNWEASTDPSVASYQVFYGLQPEAMVLSYSGTELSCMIEGLTENQEYLIGVGCLNDLGILSALTFANGTPLLIPRPPQALFDSPDTSSINIAWQPNSELDIYSYDVYRSLGTEGSLELVGTTLAPQHIFSDEEVSSTEEYYYYRVKAIDSLGHQSQFSEVISSRKVSLDRGIYVIDETKNLSGTTPFQPTGEAVDEFYENLLQSFETVHILDLEEYTGTLRLADIGVYSSILWHGNDNADFMYAHEIRDVLRQYIYLGGKVFFNLYFPSKAFELNAGYPAFYQPESFMYDVLGIAEVRYSSAARFKYAIPQYQEYPQLQVDSLKTIASWQGHIFSVEGFIPVNPDEIIYSYGSDYANTSNQGILNGLGVGIHRSYGAGQVICLSYPLYNMHYNSAEALVYHVLNGIFHEPVGIEDCAAPILPGLSILSCYPNPFNPSTTISYSVPTPQRIRIEVFNLKGQHVSTLTNEDHKSGTHTVIWRGLDDRDDHISSGIYLLRISGKSGSAIRKLMLVK